MNKGVLGIAAVALAWPVLAAAETHVVTIEGMVFRPAALTVQAGDRIVWRNRDVVPHTATAAGRFDSGAIPPGGNWSWTVQGQGTRPYVCTYHPGMQATVDIR